MEVKTDITFAISSSIVLHAVLNSLFNFPLTPCAKRITPSKQSLRNRLCRFASRRKLNYLFY